MGFESMSTADQNEAEKIKKAESIVEEFVKAGVDREAMPICSNNSREGGEDIVHRDDGCFVSFVMPNGERTHPEFHIGVDQTALVTAFSEAGFKNYSIVEEENRRRRNQK